MQLPAGPTTDETRCLICRRRAGANHSGWRWINPKFESNGLPFAGYFCQQSCSDEWRGFNETQQMAAIFPSLERGLELLARAERGEWFGINDIAADPIGVPVWSQRLDTNASMVYLEPEGKPRVFLNKLARFRLLGYRQQNSGSSWRPW